MSAKSAREGTPVRYTQRPAGKHRLAGAQTVSVHVATFWSRFGSGGEDGWRSKLRLALEQ